MEELLRMASMRMVMLDDAEKDRAEIGSQCLEQNF